MTPQPAQILAARNEANRTNRWVEIAPYRAGDRTEQNEYCLFLKPELTELQDTFLDVVTMVLDRLAAFDQHIVAGAAMDSSYLAKHRVMEQHYGVINTISREGTDALSEAGKQRLQDAFGQEMTAGARVLGGHQFLAAHPYFSASALSVLFDSLPSTKLAPGTYCVRTIVRGEPVIVLNGFHPEQLQRFTNPGASIVAFTVRSDAPWKTIRGELTGATHPAKATAGSIRGTLLQQQERFALREVSAGSNGVHASAGPVEGMVEICRYMSDGDAKAPISLTATTFGKLLGQSGFNPEQIGLFASNPILQTSSGSASVFDLTEELNATEGVRRLVEASPADSRP